jgi:membrane protease YdiL (CAAX protease family)
MYASMLTAPYLLGPLGFRGVLVFSEAVLLLPGLLVLLAARGASWRDALALVSPGRSTLLLCAGLGGTLWVASLGLLELQYAVWPPPPGYIEAFRRLHEMLRPSDPVAAAYSFAAIAVVPALCEETVVRGLLLPSLRTRLSAALSVALSAAVFSAMHFDLYRMAFTLTVGIALAGLRLRTGLLLPSLVAHAALNTLTFVAAPFLDDPSEPLPDPRPLLGFLLLALGTVATVFLWRRLPKSDVSVRS